MIVVKYKVEGKKAVAVLADLPDDTRPDEDGIHDACSDYISEMLGSEPKWIKVIGYAMIHSIHYPFKSVKTI